MDLRNIIKEAVNDFEWTEEIPSRLNTYRVTYITESYIDAHDEDEANEIYEDMKLTLDPATINSNSGPMQYLAMAYFHISRYLYYYQGDYLRPMSIQALNFLCQ